MTQSEFTKRLSALRLRALSIAFRVTRNPQDAEEAVQDANTEWWVHLQSSRKGSENDAYYFCLVRRRACDSGRKRGARRKFEVPESDLMTTHDGSEAQSPLDQAEDDRLTPDKAAEAQDEALDRRRRMDDWLSRLKAVIPQNHFDLWWQCDVEGRPIPEIAKDAGLSYEAAKSRIRRVREELRAIIRGDGNL
jgi:RNA polymerase sigma factor (sigma-70 family)